MATLTEIFYLALLTAAATVCRAILKTMYEIKCMTLNCCFGAFVILRDTSGEEQLDEHTISQIDRLANSRDDL